MLALRLSGASGRPSLAVGEVAEPRDEAGRVVVEVAFADVTRTEPDWSTNWSPDGTPCREPIVLGLEFSGTIRSVGDGVQGFFAGQRVFGTTEPDRGGSIAECVSAAASMILPTPAPVADAEASVLGLAGATAWQAIIRYGGLARGQRVLIHGGAGGVGAIATQLAAWCGAHVTVTASAQDAKLCRSLGANEVIDFERTRFESVSAPYDLVFDQIGGEVLERSWDVVRPGGRLVTIAGEKEPDQKKARERGVTARYFVFDNDRRELEALADLVAEGRIRPVIGRRIALDQADRAFAGQSGTSGKTVVRCRAD